MSVPNFITVSRLFLIPVFIFLMLEREYRFAILVFIFAGFTDVLDGYIARKYKMVTEWGKILDPLADKLMQFCALIMIVITNVVPHVLPLLLIVSAKEIMMGLGSMMLWRRGVVISANWYGKVSTIIFYTAVVFSILTPGYGEIFLIIAVASQIFAFLMYLLKYLKIQKVLTTELE